MRATAQQLAAMILAAAVGLFADDPSAPFRGVVILKDGRHIEGTITLLPDSSVDVKLKFGSAHFKAEEIEKIERRDPKPAANKVLAPVEEIDPVYGDLYMKDGRHFTGDIVLRKNTVELHMKLGMVRFEREEVDRVDEKARGDAQPPKLPQGGAPAPGPPGEPGVPEEPAPPPESENEPPLTGDWATTKEGPQPDYADPAIKERIEEANRAYEASLARHKAFRASRDENVRGREITACLAEIRKAAGAYASVLDIMPDDRWLQDRYRRAIEVLKVVRMQAGQY